MDNNNTIEPIIKVTKNRPFYWNVMLCYVVEWKQEDRTIPQTEYFDTYSEGITFLKNTFPIWFNKHFKN